MQNKLKAFKRASSSSLTAAEPVSPSCSGSSELLLMTACSSPGGTRTEKGCFRALQTFFATMDISISDETICRYACFHSFDYEATKEAILDDRADIDTDHLLNRLQMRGSLLAQFETNALFPLPGLKTKRGKSDVIYMRPSRYIPQQPNDGEEQAKSGPSKIIKNLCYVLNDLSDSEEKCRAGVAFVANMKGFTTKNYNEEYWLEFIEGLQGKLVPTRVNLFLIVNPPTWFGKIWNKTMRPMMSSAFAKTVHIVDSDEIRDYLADGYQAFLPKELDNGWRNTAELVEDYVDIKIFEDRRKAKARRRSSAASATRRYSNERLNTIHHSVKPLRL